MKAWRSAIFRQGLLVIALPLLYQTALFVILMLREEEQIAAQKAALRTKDVIEQTDRVFRTLLAAQAELRGFMITGEPVFEHDAARGLSRLSEEMGELEQLVGKDPEQQRRFGVIATKAAARLQFHNSIFAKIREGKREDAAAAATLMEGKRLMDDLAASIEEFRRVEKSRDVERLQELRRAAKAQPWVLGGGLAGAVLVAAAAAYIFSQRLGSRLAVVVQNTGRLARGEPLPARQEGSDEIAALDAAFHGVAEELEARRVREQEFHRSLEGRAEQLARANRELDQKSQENEMFVYSVSHDLRSPLVNLQGFSKELGRARAELMRLAGGEFTSAERERLRALAERDITESVHFIQTAVTRLSAIIDALLRLSRAGRVEYQPQMVDLNEIVSRIVTAMQGTIAERGAELRIGTLPPVWGDPTALEQIFANLIGNALNYLDPGRPGRIEVGAMIPAAATGVEEDSTYYVRDNGLGIDAAYLPKVFAVFQRLHPKAAPGEGIGLTLVRRMVDRHGGRIWVESEAGVGSTFFVRMPPRIESPLVLAPKKESIKTFAVPSPPS